MKALRWIGLALQIVGVVIAATGLWLTWREYGRDRSFWGPIVRLFRQGWAWSKERAIRLWVKLGGHRSATVHAVTGTATGTFKLSGTVRVGWASPPDIEADPSGFALEMTRRADALHETVQVLREQLAAEEKARSIALESLQSNVVTAASVNEQLTRDVAVGGIQLEAFGVFLVAVGILLQGIDLAVSPD